MVLTRITAFFAVALVLAYGRTARAQSVDYSPAAYVYAGALLVNGGLALANGISLALHRPDERNGRFALVTGIVTAAAGGGLYLGSRGDALDQQSALVLTAAGLASAATGGLTVWRAKRSTAEATVTPWLDPVGHRAGLVLSARL